MTNQATLSDGASNATAWPYSVYAYRKGHAPNGAAYRTIESARYAAAILVTVDDTYLIEIRNADGDTVESYGAARAPFRLVVVDRDGNRRKVRVAFSTIQAARDAATRRTGRRLVGGCRRVETYDSDGRLLAMVHGPDADESDGVA